ncbi:MAG: class I SAM-dependent methyltransferase [Acidobacteriota bacterium]
MNHWNHLTKPRAASRGTALAAGLVFTVAVATASAGGSPQAAQQKPFEPTIGQAGKDVVWVPTPPELVEKMLDMAKVTAQDLVMDLGSGDGRNIIAAARRGARAVGVEYNPDMVALSQRLAREAGVADRAVFVEGDMFTADISKATVLALFLLPDNLDKLRDKFLAMKPGTRIVLNTFGIHEWEADVTEKIEGDCVSWCTAMLYVVPAKVAGTWKVPQGELTLNQQFQTVTGVLTAGGKSATLSNGKLQGDRLTFTAGGTEYSGTVTGDRIDGVATTGAGRANWSASRGR